MYGEPCASPAVTAWLDRAQGRLLVALLSTDSSREEEWPLLPSAWWQADGLLQAGGCIKLGVEGRGKASVSRPAGRACGGVCCEGRISHGECCVLKMRSGPLASQPLDRHVSDSATLRQVQVDSLVLMVISTHVKSSIHTWLCYVFSSKDPEDRLPESDEGKTSSS